MGQGLRKKKEEIIIVISFIYLFNLCNEGGGERGREKEKKEGLRELRTQPVNSCKGVNRLCRGFILLYKYTQFTFAFGLVTALHTRVVHPLKEQGPSKDKRSRVD